MKLNKIILLALGMLTISALGIVGQSHSANLGLLVKDSASLDGEEQAAYDFAASHSFTVTKIDPASILGNPTILDTVDGFWAANASEPTEFNNPTIVSALQSRIQNGKRIWLNFYGTYFGQYLGLGTAYIGPPWNPAVSNHMYWVDKRTNHPIYQGMTPWIPPTGPPDDETKLLFYVDAGPAPGVPCLSVTAPFDTLKYVLVEPTYGWPHQNPDPALCEEYGITCTAERGIYVSYIPEIHTGCGSAIYGLASLTALDRWHYGQAGYQLLENILSYVCSCNLPGDANSDCNIDIGDVVFLINFLFKSGPAPDPLRKGDANFDNSVDIGDVVYLINYLYKGGPPPSCEEGSLSSSGSLQSLSKGIQTATVSFQPTKSPENGFFEIPLASNLIAEVAGVQLEISYNPKDITLLEPSLSTRTEGLQLYSDVKDGVLKIGILDMNGQNYIAPGEGPLVTLRAQGNDLSSLVIKDAMLVDRDANKIPVEIVKSISTTENQSVPQEFTLSQNIPNPFNPETEISYVLPSACPVKLSIYNLLGEKVRTLVDGYQTTGHKTVRWDGTDDLGNKVASGVYFYKLKAGEFTETKKMIMMK